MYSYVPDAVPNRTQKSMNQYIWSTQWICSKEITKLAEPRSTDSEHSASTFPRTHDNILPLQVTVPPTKSRLKDFFYHIGYCNLSGQSF